MTTIIVRSRGSFPAFGLAVDATGPVDTADPEVVTALRLGFLIPVDEADAAVAAEATTKSGGCGCG